MTDCNHIHWSGTCTQTIKTTTTTTTTIWIVCSVVLLLKTKLLKGSH